MKPDSVSGNWLINLFIEKPFHLLRPQYFSFQIESEFIDTFVKFSNFISQGKWLSILSQGEGFFTQLIVRGEGFLLLSSRAPGFVPGGWFWMKFIPSLFAIETETESQDFEGLWS